MAITRSVTPSSAMIAIHKVAAPHIPSRRKINFTASAAAIFCLSTFMAYRLSLKNALIRERSKRIGRILRKSVIDEKKVEKELELTA